MATRIGLKHKESGIIKDGYYGISWTTLFFGPLPALFRGDLANAIIIMISNVGTLGLAWLFYWPDAYNRKYTLKLLENGWEFNDTPDKVVAARLALKIAAGKS